MKIGMVGFGGMGKVHAYSVSNLKYFYSPLGFDAQIGGVCCSHFENAQKACSDYSLGTPFETYEQMLADDSIDVIDICTPNVFHYEQLKLAIEAGKHIY